MAAPKDIYELFKQFIETTVVEQKNFFEKTNDNIFDNDVLSSLVNICKNLSPKEEVKTEDINMKISESKDERVKKVYAHILWLQNLPVNDTSKETKISEISKITNVATEYPFKGKVRYGRARTIQVKDIIDIILLFYFLFKSNNKDYGTIKKNIIIWCLDIKSNGECPGKDESGIRKSNYELHNLTSPDALLPIHNMLLHLCDNNHYDNISATGDKKKIIETFAELIPDGCDDSKLPKSFYDNSEGYNKKYYSILNVLKGNSSKYENLQEIGNSVKIYDYKYLWKIGSDYDDTAINALKFKKAIILYGPPGTSKTFSAKLLAKNLIFQKDYKDKAKKKDGKKKVKDFLDKKDRDFESQIHRLQLHPNYTYEDFIWGYQIENKEYKDKSGNIVCVGNQTVAKKGKFLRLIKTITEEKVKKTHVLILDEINRVDLSRLFGELFSAIENRNESVDLPVEVEGKSKISIPENLYIIGTMNEIDFSLERVDFALRRRFAWFFYGYDEDSLASIIDDKIEKSNNDSLKTKFNNNLQAEYVQDCTELNKKIDDDPDLGSQYQIGHTFFAEIVDIWKNMVGKEIKSVKTILWNISIGPMIEAYLGNSDKKTKDDKVKSFRKTFGIDEK